MVAALLHNSVNPTRGVRRPRCDRRGERARPADARPGVVLPAVDGLHPRLALSGRRPRELEAGARPERRGARGGARRPGVSRRRARRAGDADDLSPLQQRVGQGAGGRDRAAGAAALRAALDRRDRRRVRPRPARHDARPGARRRPEDGVHRDAAQQRRGSRRPHAQRSAQHRQPERRRRAPHLLQRRRLRPAPARPLVARPRRDEPRRGGAPPDLASGRACSASSSAA